MVPPRIEITLLYFRGASETLRAKAGFVVGGEWLGSQKASLAAP